MTPYAVRVNSFDRTVYSQSLRFYGIELYSNPRIWVRELAGGESFTFESTYFGSSAQTEFAYITGLSGEERAALLSLYGTTTYGRRMDWIESTTSVLRFRLELKDGTLRALDVP